MTLLDIEEPDAVGEVADLIAGTLTEQLDPTRFEVRTGADGEVELTVVGADPDDTQTFVVDIRLLIGGPADEEQS